MKTFLNGRVIVKTGDITREQVDAIVNAANSSLMGGGGVDGAIHRVGGSAIIDECRELRQKQYPAGLPAGKAVATTGGKLPARFVIHTVGPVWHGGNRKEPETLADAYRNSLQVADEKGCQTVAFPAVSTGIYGFPKELAAKIVSNVLKEYVLSAGKIKTITLIFFSEDDYRIFIDHSEME